MIVELLAKFSANTYGHEGRASPMKEALRALLLLVLGAIFIVGIGVFGYGLVTLIDLVASPRGGESMTSTTMSGVLSSRCSSAG